MDAYTNPETPSQPQPDEPEGFVGIIGVSEAVEVSIGPPSVPDAATYTADEVRAVVTRATEIALAEFGIES